MSTDIKKVVLVCDTMNEIDDQLAIAYAIGSPSVEVLGVISSQNTLVHGSRSVDIYKEEADKILSLGGKSQIPSLKGARGPMESKEDVQESEGLDFMISLCDSGVDFSILATGPATDVAMLQLVQPEKIKKLPIIWAGSFPDKETWQRYKYGELNARADIQAWRVMYESVENLTVLPGWPGVVKVDVDCDQFVSELRSKSHELTDYLALISEQWCVGKKQLDMDSRRKNRKVLWDIVNVSYYSVPGALKMEERPLPYIDATGAMHWDQLGKSRAICIDVDNVAVMNDFWSSVDNLT